MWSWCHLLYIYRGLTEGHHEMRNVIHCIYIYLYRILIQRSQWTYFLGSVQGDTLAFHWHSQVLLAGARKGPMMLAHWYLTWPGVQLLIGPMKTAIDVATYKGRCYTAYGHPSSKRVRVMQQMISSSTRVRAIQHMVSSSTRVRAIQHMVSYSTRAGSWHQFITTSMYYSYNNRYYI